MIHSPFSIEPATLADLNKLHELLTTSNPPSHWTGGIEQRVARKFVSAFKRFASKDATELQECDVPAFSAAVQYAEAAYRAAKLFDSSTPDLNLDALVACNAPNSRPRQKESSTQSNTEPQECGGCRARFEPGELAACASIARCPMCCVPFGVSNDNHDDWRWWKRENPDFRIPYVSAGKDLSAHVGNVVFLELATLEIEADPIRPLDAEKVKAIAESLRINPLVAPIGVTAACRLKFGRHRAGAHVSESRRWIKTLIVEDNLETEYLALAENVCRAELCLLQRASALRRMREIYEQLHPETKAGVAGGLAGGRGRSSEQVRDPASAIPFTAHAAQASGESRRGVQEMVQIGGIAPRAQGILIGLPKVKDNKTKLLQIARAETEVEQVTLAEQLASMEGLRATTAVTAAVLTLTVTLRDVDGARVGEERHGGRVVRLRVDGDVVTVEIARVSAARTAEYDDSEPPTLE